MINHFIFFCSRALSSPKFEKILMCMNIIFHPWYFLPHYVYEDSYLIKDITKQDIEDAYGPLSSTSLNVLERHLFIAGLVPAKEFQNLFLYNFSKLFTQEEIAQQKQCIQTLKKIRKKYHLNTGFPESLIFHHGLSDASPSTTEYIKNKLFLDVGACGCDSSSIFLKYAPYKIMAFEPCDHFCKDYVSIMMKNNVSKTKFELIPKFVSDVSSDSTVSIDDSLVSVKDIPVGLLKADVEGMGLKVLFGAQYTIKRWRPVLSIAIYHNREEFLDIAKTIRSWNLNYRLEVKSLGIPLILSETVLLAIPEELIDV